MPTGKRKADPEAEVTTSKPANRRRRLIVTWLDGRQATFHIALTNGQLTAGLKAGWVKTTGDVWVNVANTQWVEVAE